MLTITSMLFSLVAHISSFSCSSEDNKIFKDAVSVTVVPVLVHADAKPFWGAKCDMLYNSCGTVML